MQHDITFDRKKLRELRTSSGLTTEAFADHLEISRWAMLQYESGLAMSDMRDLFLLSSYFGVPMEFFVELRELKAPKGTAMRIAYVPVRLSMLKRR